MTNPRELRRRIQTIRNIERTVDALQKISAARLMRDKAAALAGRPYVEALVRLTGDLSSVPGVAHPLLEVNEGDGFLMLLIGADRGMCGAYNTNLVRAAKTFIATHGRRNLRLLVAGTKLRRFLPGPPLSVKRDFIRFPRPLAPVHVGEVAQSIIDAFVSREVVRVYLVYTQFRAVSVNRPVVRRILPFRPRPGARPIDPIFEPDVTAVIERLLPQYVRAAVRQAFIEASASEHAARMVMMEQASVNARRMIDGLTLTANKLRQAIITRELSDIVGTVEALA